MTAVDRLFDQYRDEFEASGFADPQPYLRQLDGAERSELETRLERFLSEAPGRRWDRNAYEGSAAQRAVAAMEEAAEGGLWPELLPSLRTRAKLKRQDVVRRLAEALGASDQEQRVADYYHEMEQGLLPEQGVSNRVLRSLGEILGESAESLRKAGRALVAPGERGNRRATEAFARIAITDASYDTDLLRAMRSPGTEAPAAAQPMREPDELDRLFTGGPGED